MTVRSTMWRRIRFVVFVGLFLSLLATYWVYSYETDLSPGREQTVGHPYRGHTILLAAISALLFGAYAYIGYLERRDQIPT